VFPSHQHETVAPVIPDTVTPGAVLVFTKTNSFRHKEAIPAGVTFFQSLAIEKGWSHEEEWYSWEESVRAKGFMVLAASMKIALAPYSV